MTSTDKSQATSNNKRRKKPPKTPDGQMSLREHLRELRNRLFKAAIAIVLGTIVGFIVYQPAFTILTEPITRLSTDEAPVEVIFSSVAQPFDIMLQVALFIGLILSSPIWLYQIWAFIVPGLKKQERRYAVGFIAAAVPLFVGGIALGWFALPQALAFFTSLTPDGTAHRVLATVYIPFVTRLLLAFGIALVIPVVLVGLNMAGILEGKTMLKHWRISVFLIAVIAAMGAPGSDIMTMFYLGAPLTLLFGLALGVALLNDRRRAKREATEGTPAEAEIQRGAQPLSEFRDED
ncbi:twin-arginine translocase subunit TatC [Enteractinococcus coprophilus]|uniref:Sec-independent protein translocase protein TatC n=2 Tax=Enteractinococcus coprophilus TaxID=1027633 RepID=A0A543AJI5_9MICC|nr:twin-arginine translocase subunit TatC [Enteractinococcus coprophilus]TQL72686.1 sec-independent protein translocase protein TatC [Enteractinococcus coprophilus]